MTSVAERVTRTESQTRVRRDAVPRKRKARRFSLRRLPFYFLIALIFVYTVFPFYWAIRSALTAARATAIWSGITSALQPISSTCRNAISERIAP